MRFTAELFESSARESRSVKGKRKRLTRGVVKSSMMNTRTAVNPNSAISQATMSWRYWEIRAIRGGACFWRKINKLFCLPEKTALTRRTARIKPVMKLKALTRECTEWRIPALVKGFSSPVITGIRKIAAMVTVIMLILLNSSIASLRSYV